MRRFGVFALLGAGLDLAFAQVTQTQTGPTQTATETATTVQQTTVVSTEPGESPDIPFFVNSASLRAIFRTQQTDTRIFLARNINTVASIRTPFYDSFDWRSLLATISIESEREETELTRTLR